MPPLFLAFGLRTLSLLQWVMSFWFAGSCWHPADDTVVPVLNSKPSIGRCSHRSWFQCVLREKLSNGDWSPGNLTLKQRLWEILCDTRKSVRPLCQGTNRQEYSIPKYITELLLPTVTESINTPIQQQLYSIVHSSTFDYYILSGRK